MELGTKNLRTMRKEYFYIKIPIGVAFGAHIESLVNSLRVTPVGFFV